MSGSAVPVVAAADAIDQADAQGVRESMIVGQVEYYLSRDNLSRDAYLQSQMDADQFVALSVLAEFNKLKSLSTDVAAIAAALRGSRLVELDATGTRVKPRARPQRNTIILREIPSSAPPDQVHALFAGEGAPRVLEVRAEVGDNWFVVLDSEDAALEALNWLRAQTFNGEPVRARMKTESSSLRSFYVSGQATRPIVPFVPQGAPAAYFGPAAVPWDFGQQQQQQPAAQVLPPAAQQPPPAGASTGGAPQQPSSHGGPSYPSRYGGGRGRENKNRRGGGDDRRRDSDRDQRGVVVSSNGTTAPGGSSSSRPGGGERSREAGGRDKKKAHFAPGSGSSGSPQPASGAGGAATAPTAPSATAAPRRPEPELTSAMFPPLSTPAAGGVDGVVRSEKGGYGSRTFLRYGPETLARIVSGFPVDAERPAHLSSLMGVPSGPVAATPVAKLVLVSGKDSFAPSTASSSSAAAPAASATGAAAAAATAPAKSAGVWGPQAKEAISSPPRKAVVSRSAVPPMTPSPAAAPPVSAPKVAAPVETAVVPPAAVVVVAPAATVVASPSPSSASTPAVAAASAEAAPPAAAPPAAAAAAAQPSNGVGVSWAQIAKGRR